MNQVGKYHFFSVVVSPFHLLDVIEKLLLRNSVMFHQPFFSKRPESFDAVDVDFSLLEFVLMINTEVTISTKHERIILHAFLALTSSSNNFMRRSKETMDIFNPDIGVLEKGE